MPRVDIKHLLAKGNNKKLADQVIAYAQLMKQQGKPCERIIITQQQYDALIRIAGNHGGRPVLCCGDALIYYNHDFIDESAPQYMPRVKFDAGLPPVSANPFGIAAPVKAPDLPPFEPGPIDWDDDIPF